jgi:hypothetical protein
VTVKSETPPAAAEDPVAAKAKAESEAAKARELAEAEAAKAQAQEAKTKLKLIRVTSRRKLTIASPNSAWSVIEGANHFEGDVPKEVAEAYAKLIADKVIEVAWIDGTGKAHPWTAPKLPNDDGKQH